MLATVAWQVGLAQTSVSGVVVNDRDSSPISFARIVVDGSGTPVVADAQGRFRLPLGSRAALFRVRVTSLDVDTTFVFAAPVPVSMRLRVSPRDFEIGDVTVRGLSARGVIAEAVNRIPQNYSDSGHVLYGFYRQYSRVDGTFRNLLEARAAAMIRPRRGKQGLEAEHAFALLAMRRQRYRSIAVEGVNLRDGLPELFEENSIYFLANSSLALPMLGGIEFHFDTANRTNDYVITYRRDISSERHGCGPTSGDWTGESYEVGRLTSNRRSLAFVHIERKAYRDKNYDYPKNNNYILPRRRHTMQFVDGQLDIRYARQGGRWFLSSLHHHFTDEFFRTGILGYGKECTLNEAFEWQTNSVSRYVPGEMLSLFFKEPYAHLVEGSYEKPLSGAIPPCFFVSKDVLYEAVGWENE